MAPAHKKRKVTVERYKCTICLTDRVATAFPDYNPTETCKDHLINTCKQCLKKYIEVQVEGGELLKGGIKCPECDEVMRSNDVQIATTKKIFERFDELERRWIANSTPGWRWCLSSRCRAGQIHEEKIKPEILDDKAAAQALMALKAKPSIRMSLRSLLNFKSEPQPVKPDPGAGSTKEEVDICTCNDCGARACVACDRPWHDGEGCEQYQGRIKDRLEEENATLKAISKHTKDCPKCSKHIEKNGGCRHMHCSQCWTEFCWECMQIIGANGVYCKCVNRPG